MNRRVALLSGLVVLPAVGACATMNASPQTTGPQPAGLEVQIAAYVEIQEALAADNFDGARTHLGAFARVADDATQGLAEAALEADDIEELRTQFKPLSESLTTLELPQGFAHAFCPMYDAGNGAPWVQRDGPVRNPYYGAVMLNCGDVGGDTTAHMDHTPRQGGTVFMGADPFSFLHVEGTYPEPGLFRLYGTNGDREPVDVSGWGGRVVTEEVYDEQTDEFLEVTVFDLVPSPDGAYLEALLPNGSVSQDVIAKVLFQEGLPNQRFDFIFDLSAENALSASAVTFDADAPAAAPLAERIQPDIPTKPEQIVAELALRDEQIVEMIERGAFTEIFIPALQSKELALALQAHGAALPERARNQVRIAVRHLVRAAYLLDWYGDLGNKLDVDSAYDVFGSMVAEIVGVYDQAAR
jgi:hypothetical protein